MAYQSLLFLSFLLFTPGKRISRENNVEFNFRIGHVHVIFLFWWIEKEKLKENSVSLSAPKNQYLCFHIGPNTFSPNLMIMGTFRNTKSPKLYEITPFLVCRIAHDGVYERVYSLSRSASNVCTASSTIFIIRFVVRSIIIKKNLAPMSLDSVPCTYSFVFDDLPSLCLEWNGNPSETYHINRVFCEQSTESDFVCRSWFCLAVYTAANRCDSTALQSRTCNFWRLAAPHTDAPAITLLRWLHYSVINKTVQ